MADASNDQWQVAGVDLATNPQKVNIGSGLTATESAGTVTVTASGITSAMITDGTIVAGDIADEAATPAKTNIVEAITATDTGATTGTISDTTTFAQVDADGDANHIVVLPTPTVGRVVYLAETGTTGFELRTSAPSTVLINAATGGAAVESAIAGAITLVRCVCVSSTNWVCTQFDADGDESKVEAAA